MKIVNNIKMAYWLLFIPLLLEGVTLVAQTNPKPITSANKMYEMGVWQLYRNDSLRLLWSPVSGVNWEKYNAVGYRVERAEKLKGKIKVYKLLTPTPIRPVAAKDWKADSPESSLAKKILYEVPAKDTANDQIGSKQANTRNFRHIMGTLAAFKSKAVAQQMGLSFVDLKLKKNTSYLYKIYPNLSKSDKFDTTYVLVETAKPTTIKKPPMLTVESEEKAVVLTWPSSQYSRDFIMYHIERSSNGTIYEKITSSPQFNGDARTKESFFKDSLTQNYRPYLYRLVGMTPFGEWITSTLPIMAMGKDKTPPSQPQIEYGKHTGGSKIEIKWNMPIQDGDLKGFWVGRASNLSSKFKKITDILPKTVSKITDFKAEVTGTNHYVVYAVDTSGNERASFPVYVTLTDSMPPAAPKGLACKVVMSQDKKSGMVAIQWQSNKEKDLQGYYVYFANDPDHEFSQITKRMLKDTVFRDTITLRSLTKNVFYKVVAVDNHYNISEFSGMASVKRPDIIKPVAPLITDVKIEDNTATLLWQRSPSNDVVEYSLYRREQNKEWVKVKGFRGPELSKRQFIDNLQTDNVYEYYVQVIDESGLISDPSPIKTAKKRPKLFTDNGPEPTVTYNQERKLNIVSWKYRGKGFYKIAIYRAEGKEGYHLIGFGSVEESDYTDKPMRLGKYKYVLKAMYDNGQESKFSEPVEIEMI